ERDEPENQQQQTDDGREYRASYRSLRDSHDRCSSTARCGLAQLGLHAAAVAHVLRAFDDDVLVLSQPLHDLDLAGPPLARAHLAPLDDVVADDEDECLALLRHDCGLGYEQCRLRLAV